MPPKLGMSAIKDRADQGLGSSDFRFAPRRTTNTDCSTSVVLVGAVRFHRRLNSKPYASHQKP